MGAPALYQPDCASADRIWPLEAACDVGGSSVGNDGADAPPGRTISSHRQGNRGSRGAGTFSPARTDPSRHGYVSLHPLLAALSGWAGTGGGMYEHRQHTAGPSDSAGTRDGDPGRVGLEPRTADSSDADRESPAGDAGGDRWNDH